MNNSFKEKAMQLVFLLAACASIIAVILICVFIFGNGIPAMQKIGIINFLTGTLWEPFANVYGILPMQQALRISDNTAFFLLGEVVEYDKTEKLFSIPSNKKTEDYITGRFG